MSRMLFVNHPVHDLARSKAFFTHLGFDFNPAFGDDNAACLIINDQACVMLLATKFFEGFHHKQTADATTTAETILTVSADSREDVDDLCHKAFAAGATKSEPLTDQGSMYGWSFQDLDGHLWEVIWMDQSASC